MTESRLENRDYTLIVAKTAPSHRVPPPGYATRWSDAHTAIVRLAQTCEALDPDGITIYISCRDQAGFVQYKQAKAAKIAEIFDQHYPPDDLSLLTGLQTALDEYFARKANGQTKANGETIIVLIDGEPVDRMAIVQSINAATQQLERREELGIGFAQIGEDAIVRGFLNALDTDLRSTVGAKFDIVTTRVLAEIAPDSLTEFLLAVIRQ